MLHTATLIHDDIIDNATVRRGIPTLNAQLPVTAAVLAGDMVFAQAARLIARTGIPLIVERFSTTLETICRGELDQMFRNDGCLPSQEAYFGRIFAKTASLFSLCAQIGPLLSQSSPERIQQAQQFGRLVGEAFQITDDVLDLLGDSHKTGKPVGVDIRQGLATLPIILYAEDHPDDRRLHEVLSGTANEPQIGDFLSDLIRSGATGQGHAAEPQGRGAHHTAGVSSVRSSTARSRNSASSSCSIAPPSVANAAYPCLSSSTGTPDRLRALEVTICVRLAFEKTRPAAVDNALERRHQPYGAIDALEFTYRQRAEPRFRRQQPGHLRGKPLRMSILLLNLTPRSSQDVLETMVTYLCRSIPTPPWSAPSSRP